MSHDHEPHDHPHVHEGDLPAALDSAVADADLAPSDLGRRRFLQRAGLLGAGAAAASVLGPQVTSAAAADAASPAPRSSAEKEGGYRWLAGDHHIHTQFSPDGQYRVIDQVQHGNAYGLDWMVITDHGSDQHTRIGVDLVNPKIVAGPPAGAGHPGLPGPRVEHPGRGARHRRRPPGAERGQRPQAVRDRLRRQRPRRHRHPRRQHAGERGRWRRAACTSWPAPSAARRSATR